MSELADIERFVRRNNTFKGRKPITLDISYEEFINNPISYVKDNLGKCLNQHRKNVKEIEHLEDVYLGDQDINEKVRINANESCDNIVVENHIHAIVDFATAFQVGNPIEYSNASAKKTDDMDYFNKYLTNAKKAALDIEKYSNLKKYGIAYRMVVYKSKDIINTDFESPFDIYNIDPRYCFVCRESGIRKRTLFSCIMSKKLVGNVSKTFYTIYLDNGFFEVNSKYELTTPYTDMLTGDGTNPIIEYEDNPKRTGLIEIVESLQNAINMQTSLQLDDIAEFVNYYLVFKNQNFDDEDFKRTYLEFKKDRALLLKSVNPQMQADVSMLKNSMDHTDLNTLYERLVHAMYNVLAIPMASGNVTSGGDTGAARLLGNGWETAQNKAEMDTTWIEQFERIELTKMLAMSKDIINSKINDLYSSDIVITYKINMSDNLYVKTESLNMLYNMNFPKEIALNICKITSDAHGVAESWIKEDNLVKTNALIAKQASTDINPIKE